MGKSIKLLKDQLLKFESSYEELLELAVVLYAHRIYRQIIISLKVEPRVKPLLIIDDADILTDFRRIIKETDESPENYHRHERCLFYLSELNQLNPKKDEVIKETTELKLIWVALELKSNK